MPEHFFFGSPKIDGIDAKMDIFEKANALTPQTIEVFETNLESKMNEIFMELELKRNEIFWQEVLRASWLWTYWWVLLHLLCLVTA